MIKIMSTHALPSSSHSLALGSFIFPGRHNEIFIALNKIEYSRADRLHPDSG